MLVVCMLVNSEKWSLNENVTIHFSSLVQVTSEFS